MPRLYHTKSKTGCSQCRARRVKCDEGRPKCGTCTRHKVECTYDRTKSLARTKGPARDNAFFVESRERRYREMQLLHTFSSRLCGMLPGTSIPEMRELWGVDVPQLAMTCEPLLNSILAFTCQYQAVKAKGDPKAAEKYLVWRSHYLDMTLPKHRQALGHITVKNADAMCLTTVLLNLGAVASLHDRQLVPYEPPTQWLQLLRSIGDVTAFAMDLIRDSPDSKFWLVIKTMLPYIHQFRDLDHSTSEYYSSLLRPTPEEMIDDVDMEAYTETAKILNWIYLSRQVEELQYARQLAAFPKLLPAHFVSLVESRRPRAMAMLAHFFALATFARNVWWFGDMPYQELKAVQTELAGSEWEGIMAWPNELAALLDGVKTGTD